MSSIWVAGLLGASMGCGTPPPARDGASSTGAQTTAASAASSGTSSAVVSASSSGAATSSTGASTGSTGGAGCCAGNISPQATECWFADEPDGGGACACRCTATPCEVHGQQGLAQACSPSTASSTGSGTTGSPTTGCALAGGAGGGSTGAPGHCALHEGDQGVVCSGGAALGASCACLLGCGGGRAERHAAGPGRLRRGLDPLFWQHRRVHGLTAGLEFVHEPLAPAPRMH
jgi:hypothetical protein